MRLDVLLFRLRFARSRGAAQRWIGEGHIRRNSERVTRNDQVVVQGDVLTLPIGRGVQIVRIERLPDRRGPASEAQACYAELRRRREGDGADAFESALDPRNSIAIAGDEAGPSGISEEG